MPNVTRSLKLGELKISRVRKDGEVENMPLTASPYYQALTLGGDAGKLVYDEYTSRLDAFYPDDHSGLDYSGFMELLSSIRTNGFEETFDPVRVIGNSVYDGQHRLAIMLYLYGKDQAIELEYDTMIGLA